jgi:SAM-dependent methyltransferase
MVSAKAKQFAATLPGLETRMKIKIDDRFGWEEIWRRNIDVNGFRLEGKDFDERARIWDRAMRGNGESGYVDELLSSMNLSRDMTVLDVGCGSGIVAIPMTRHVRWVTAIDSASAMIDLTRAYAVRAEAHNLSAINKDWLRVEIGKDIEPHDIALASRSLQTGELRKYLSLLDKSARKQCFITWGAGAREDDAEICDVLGIEYKTPSSYMIIYNLLYEMGILADVEIHSKPVTRWYRDVDEAVSFLLRGRHVKQAAMNKLKTHFKNRLQFKGGRYWRTIHAPWALISWKKGSDIV